MNRFHVIAGVFCWVVLLVVPPLSWAQPADEPSIISLADMEAFQGAGASWQIVGNAAADRKTSGDMMSESGSGVLIYRPGSEDGGNLVTEMTHGDLRLELDFMMSKGAESGIFLQGRYEVQLADSWGVRNPRASDNGGVVSGEGMGLHPYSNASRAPGLWQHLEIVFRAPTFDANGRKTSNAAIRRVAINGEVVQGAVELRRTSATAPTMNEQAEGPLVFQEGSAPVAYRNIRIWRSDSAAVAAQADPPPAEPIYIAPTDEPRILRSYVDHRGEKKLYGVFVGDPAGVHYALDLEQGALLHTWRGGFLDAGTVWRGRGMEPNSRMLDEPEPRGATISFSGAPDIALLADEDAAWPDTMGTAYRFKGHSIDANGRPIFKYRLGDLEVTDQFWPAAEGNTLTRQLTVTGSAGSRLVWSRLATAPTVTRTGEGAYSIDDQTYLIEVTDVPAGSPVIREADGRSELLVPISVADGPATLKYSIIW